MERTNPIVQTKQDDSPIEVALLHTPAPRLESTRYSSSLSRATSDGGSTDKPQRLSNSSKGFALFAFQSLLEEYPSNGSKLMRKPPLEWVTIVSLIEKRGSAHMMGFENNHAKWLVQFGESNRLTPLESYATLNKFRHSLGSLQAVTSHQVYFRFTANSTISPCNVSCRRVRMATVAKDFSVSQLEKLLYSRKSELDKLVRKRDQLRRQLDQVQSRIASVQGNSSGSTTRTRRRPKNEKSLHTVVTEMLTRNKKGLALTPLTEYAYKVAHQAKQAFNSR